MASRGDVFPVLVLEASGDGFGGSDEGYVPELR
jgi:hypothetical protein